MLAAPHGCLALREGWLLPASGSGIAVLWEHFPTHGPSCDQFCFGHQTSVGHKGIHAPISKCPELMVLGCLGVLQREGRIGFMEERWSDLPSMAPGVWQVEEEDGSRSD